MGLKELEEYINNRMKEHSLARAKFHEGFFEDSVIVSHPDQAEGLGSAITITKVFGWWYLVYEPHKGADSTIELQIKSNDGIDDVNEIVNFVNSHTMHETPEEEIANKLEPEEGENEPISEIETKTE